MTSKRRARGQIGAFTSGDPLTFLLRGCFELKPWVITLATVFLLNTPIIVVAFIDNLWLSTPSRIGLLHDYNWWILQATTVSTTLFYFFALPDSILSVIEGLRNNRAIVIPKNDDDHALDHFIDRFDRIYSHWGWVVLSLVLIAGFVVLFMVPEHKQFKNWPTSGPLIFWYTIFFWGLVSFLGLLGIIRVLIAIAWFNRLFWQYRIALRVLHPDGAGGLSPLGQFSVRIGYLIGIYGLAAVSTTLSESYVMTRHFSGPMVTGGLVPLLLVYLILAPVVFFAPIGAARSAMKAAKSEFLLQIAEQFEIDTAKVQSLLSADSEELKKSLEKLEQLQRIHDIATRFPVWPFNTENLVRFFSSVFSPFVLGVISVISVNIDLLKK